MKLHRKFLIFDNCHVSNLFFCHNYLGCELFDRFFDGFLGRHVELLHVFLDGVVEGFLADDQHHCYCFENLIKQEIKVLLFRD